MEPTIKCLFIIVNAGFANDVVEIIRGEGAMGATIINSRGENAAQRVFMGITVDVEKEIILCLIEESISEKILLSIKTKAGHGTPANSVCFLVPVEKTVGLHAHDQG